MRVPGALVVLAVAGAVPFAAAQSPSAASPAPSVTIRGTVRDLLDRPVAGALVAVVDAESARRARCDARGHFAVATAPGIYALTATAPWAAAGSVGPVTVVADAVVDVRVGGNGCAFSGRVTDDLGVPAPGVPLRFVRGEAGPLDVFYTESDEAGRYRVVLPPAVRYQVAVDSPDYVGQRVSVEGAPARVLDVVVARRLPAPEEAVAWIHRQAHALATVEPGRGLADLEPLRAVVGDARVVGLGEATHGSREFFQLKHRLLEFLVEQMGFTVLAMEAGWPGSLAVDDYVVSGQGDARSALTGMGLWPWDTEEVLAVIEWMRRYNADRAHARKLRFYGFDRHHPSIDPLAPPPLAALLPWNDPERDETMAEHVRLILEHQPQGARMVLWAHNDHVSRERGELQPMGAYLSEWLGRGYRAFGFAFARGGFRAIDWSRGPGRPGTVCEPSVGPPPPDTLEAALLRAGLPLLALDLWASPGPALPRWLEAPRRMRETGVVFAGEAAMARTRVLPSAFDALFFVDETAPARPLAPARLATKTR